MGDWQGMAVTAVRALLEYAASEPGDPGPVCILVYAVWWVVCVCV